MSPHARLKAFHERPPRCLDVLELRRDILDFNNYLHSAWQIPGGRIDWFPCGNSAEPNTSADHRGVGCRGLAPVIRNLEPEHPRVEVHKRIEVTHKELEPQPCWRLPLLPVLKADEPPYAELVYHLTVGGAPRTMGEWIEDGAILTQRLKP